MDRLQILRQLARLRHEAQRPVLGRAARLDLEARAQLGDIAGQDAADHAAHLGLHRAAARRGGSPREHQRQLGWALHLPQKPIVARQHHASAAQHRPGHRGDGALLHEVGAHHRIGAELLHHARGELVGGGRAGKRQQEKQGAHHAPPTLSIRICGETNCSSRVAACTATCTEWPLVSRCLVSRSLTR